VDCQVFSHCHLLVFYINLIKINYLLIHYFLQFPILVKCYEYLHPLVEPKQNIMNQNIFDQDCSSDIFKKLQVQMNLQKACLKGVVEF
jgi:hypothetical protein